MPNSARLNLWFEDDLFCQVNLWFLMHLITHNSNITEAYLIRPSADIQYGFGGMRKNELIEAFNRRQHITHPQLQILADMWKHYRDHDHKKMLVIARKYNSELPFLLNAVRAQIDRFPSDGSLGRPQKTLKKLISIHDTDNFGQLFQAFSKQESIYGFGDLQVKKMMNELNL